MPCQETPLDCARRLGVELVCLCGGIGEMCGSITGSLIAFELYFGGDDMLVSKLPAQQ